MALLQCRRDSIADEGTDEEEENDYDYDLDELDAFQVADTTSLVDITGQIEMGIERSVRLGFSWRVPRSRRIDLCGVRCRGWRRLFHARSEPEPEDVEHEVVELVSEVTKGVDESSVVYPVLEQGESDMEFVEGPSSTKHRSNAQHDCLVDTAKSTSPQACHIWNSGRELTKEKASLPILAHFCMFIENI